MARVCEQPREKVTPEASLEGDLGFDSLMFTDLSAAFEDLGIPLPSGEELMQVATVGELARRVSEWKRGGRTSTQSHRGDSRETQQTGRRKSSLFGSLLDALQPAIDQVPMLSTAVALARTEGMRFLDDLVPPAREETRQKAGPGEVAPIELPDAVVSTGKEMLRVGQKSLYEAIFETKVVGRVHVPQHVNFLVAANHASHLDMGLVKHALGDQGDNLVALAARDYFFSNRLRRTYFENFTTLIPMDRHGSLRESLALAARSLRQGKNLLIFPEGTRATDGEIKDFKGSIGYLALTNKVGILPVYLKGTYDVLPKGRVVPKGRDLGALIGPFLPYEALAAMVHGLPRSEQHREVARVVEEAVRALATGGKAPVLVPRSTVGAPGPAAAPAPAGMAAAGAAAAGAAGETSQEAGKSPRTTTSRRKSAQDIAAAAEEIAKSGPPNTQRTSATASEPVKPRRGGKRVEKSQ